MASKQTGTAWQSMGVTGDTWIPVIMAVMTAVSIGMLPFLLLFLPTPLFSKVISLIAGMFIWLTTWRIIDAVVHSFAMDYAAAVAQQVKQYNLGTMAINSFSTFGLKALSAFGNIRWSGLMLATVITGMLVKFGGSALAHLAGELTGTVQGTSGNAGQMKMDPGAAGNKIDVMKEGIGTQQFYSGGNDTFREAIQGSYMQHRKAGGTGEMLSKASSEYMAAHPGSSPAELDAFLASGGMNPSSTEGLAHAGYSLSDVRGEKKTEETKKLD